MAGKELNIVPWVNEPHERRKRNAVRRARRLHEIAENATAFAINAGVVIGSILMIVGCCIIDNPANDPNIGMPWGYLIGGLLLFLINGILKYSLEENEL